MLHGLLKKDHFLLNADLHLLSYTALYCDELNALKVLVTVQLSI